ncbi:MAG: CotH kinase family protein [Planctomycetes bacterium]|nr:CotH kinase family protein [Planctomycetota bacterium]
MQPRRSTARMLFLACLVAGGLFLLLRGAGGDRSRRSRGGPRAPPLAARWTEVERDAPVSPRMRLPREGLAAEALEPVEPAAPGPEAAPEPQPAAEAGPIGLREYPPEKSVVVSEICYHPSSGDRRDEWIEIANRSTAVVGVGGWKLSGGVRLTIPEGTSLAPGSFLVLCADAARLKGLTGLERAVGDWTGGLSGGGERVRLETAGGAVADEVHYDDRAPFPALADGQGRSLERRSPHEASDLTANWGAHALVPDRDQTLVVRLSSGGTGVPGLTIAVKGQGGGSTPGRRNSIHAEVLPPFVHPVSHAPFAPRPGEKVRVRASVRAPAGHGEVAVHYDDGTGERSAPLAREEAAGQGGGGPDAGADPACGVFSAELGPFRRGGLVRYRVTARDARGRAAGFPLEGGGVRALGFLVGEPPERSDLPLYQLFVSPEELRSLDQSPFSDAYRRGAFACGGRVWCDVGVRYRGHTSRGIWKHHWKVRFPRDDPFLTPAGEEVTNVNLNSSFGDKTYLREVLAFNLWRDIGEAHSQAWHAIVQLNGEHLGLYVHVENPGTRYLRRNRLEAGWLWKAYGEGHSSRGFQLRSGEPESGRALLEEVLDRTRSLSGDALEAHLEEHVRVDSFLSFLAACQVIHSADHVQKNYLVHAGPEGKLAFLPWDMDLTHGRNFECDGGGIWNDEIRHDLWDPEHRDDALLFGTRVHVKCDGYWNALIDAVLRRTKAFRKPYYERIAEILARHYHPEILIPKIRRLQERIRAEAIRDREKWGTYGGGRGFDSDCDALAAWARRRFRHLETKLEGLGVAVGKPLNADLEADRQLGDAPLRVAFRASTAGEVASIEWDFGDGAKSAERDPVHVYERPGRYDVVLRVTGPAGTHAALRRRFLRVQETRKEPRS